MRKLWLFTLASFIGAIILILGFIGLRFGSALFQEGNPIPILHAILKLELENKGFQRIDLGLNQEITTHYDRETVTYVSHYKVKYPYGMPKESLKSLGWTYKEQVGSGLLFEMEGKVITVATRQFSKHYYLWRLPKSVLP